MNTEYRGTSHISIGKVPGLLRLGVIVGFDPNTLKVDVYLGALREYNAIKQDHDNNVSAQLPINYYSPLDKIFVGGYPSNGTPVIMGQGEGGQWYIVSMIAKDPAALNRKLPFIPKIEEDSYILQNLDTFIKLQPKKIHIGTNSNNLILDTKREVYRTHVSDNYHFTEASRTIDGLIRRDVEPNQHYSSLLRETSIDYDDTLKQINLDPVAGQQYSNVGSAIRNPPRVEKREVIYEFARTFNVSSDDQEFNSYKDQKNIVINDIINRRESRVDALSLSLVAPNYLMETIKGTVVDLYGNILDINRSIIPIGKIEKLSIQKIKNNLQENDPLGNVFDNIKTLERREIAYHFEINSKKKTLGGPPSVTNFDNYARQRSRFYLDIDKEGLFKLNVPASSETGNIPLLTRYENFSTVHPNDDTKDANDLAFNNNYQDILIESFGKNGGEVVIKDELDGLSAPIDDKLSIPSRSADPSKLSQTVTIKHGTAYHSISDTCISFQNYTFNEHVATTGLGSGRVAKKQTMVSQEVKISGTNANGGGRSGSLNFDGSLDINIGANTVDRQSVWLDLQGGMIGNVGRDIRNNVSAALNFDGEVLIQSGGTTPDTDTRFNKPGINNGVRAGAVDIRVLTAEGTYNVVRIDGEGISIHSEGRIVLYSHMNMMFRSKGQLHIDAEDLVLNGRKVRRDPGLNSI